ncbi:MAG TPA: hypothetical protein VK914_01175 [bacterium]|jgi:hypothetical protein|nr:hypothetical protein [bacterium]
MPPETNSSPRPKEGGQLFAGWVLGIFLITAMIIYVADAVRRSRSTTQSTIYRELALNVAKAGFEEGLSFFRTHPGGCYLTSAEAPLSQNWVVPWPTYPDSAFLPLAGNTDFFSNISLYAAALNVTCAGGIIGDIPMDQYVTYTGSDELTGSTLWGRYVIRRQNTQNWSPGPDTATVNTDPDACHDISAIAAQSPLGSGTRWSIVSRGYLIRLPYPVTTTSYTSSLLGNPAAFTDGNLLSAPLGYYNNQPFLLAQARVYGELTRVNFNLPGSAVLVPWCSTTTAATTMNTCDECASVNGQTLMLNENSILNGTGGSALTALYPDSNIYEPGVLDTYSQNNIVYMAPSITNCFPGQTWGTLQKIATQLEPPGGPIQGYVGGIEQLPVFNGTNSVTQESFQTQVNQPAFYFLDQNITLGSSTTSGPVLSGVGLCIVEGNLTIPAGNNSTWSGVLYVKGQVILDGPTDINGILVSESGIELGNASDLNKTTVAYDGGAITLVQSLLKSFIVDSSSIVANQF